MHSFKAITTSVTLASMLVLVGCGNEPVHYEWDMGESLSSSASSSGSSTPPPPCTNHTPIAPSVNDGGYGYFEDGVFACRRLIPTIYPWHISKMLVKAHVGGICKLLPAMTSAVAQKEQLGAFEWGEVKGVEPDGSGGMDVSVNLEEGQAFFGCVTLPAKSENERACLESCYVEYSGLNNDFLWGDTFDPTMGGTVLMPPSLEPLAESPTPIIAKQLGNDRLWLAIHVIGSPGTNP